MALDRNIKKIIKEIAKEEGLSETIVELAVLSQFLFTKEVIDVEFIKKDG